MSALADDRTWHAAQLHRLRDQPEPLRLVDLELLHRLVDGDLTGKPFTEAAFSHWFADRCDEAKLPTKTRASGEVVRLCTPHGLRKRCLTDLADSGRTIHEITAVSGHMTMKQVERYTRMADRARNARKAMEGRTEQSGNIEGPKVSHR
jgi:integrase